MRHVAFRNRLRPNSARDAAEPCLASFTALGTDLFQSQKLLARVQGATPANAHQAKLRKDLLEGFEDSGASLPPGKRARAKAIFDQLEELRQAFDRNIRDDPTKVVFTRNQQEMSLIDKQPSRIVKEILKG